MLKRLAVRIILAVLGTAVTLAWWTYRGSHNSRTQGQDHIPSSVWGGSAAKITVEAESTTPATMAIDFNEHNDAPGEQKMLHTWEKFTGGAKTWTVECPAQVGGYIELDADHPHAGDKLKWRVTINGELIKEEEWTLDQELEPRTAMFLQLFFDDYSKAPQVIKDAE